MKEKQSPMKLQNLIDVVTYFADKQVATEHLIQLRWNGKITCPHCNGVKVYTLKGATKRFKCASCREQFSATKGTIFENSPIPLNKWFGAIFLITSHKKGIASTQLAKDLGVTQKSAWFMLQRVRYALQTGTFTHSKDAVIEIDETFVGGKEKNKHKSKLDKKWNEAQGILRTNEKIPVFGLVERGGKVMAQRVNDITGKSLLPIIQENIKETVSIYSDEHTGYRGLAKFGYAHEKVSHGGGEYVRGNVHINTIEGFWGLFKRGIIGTYHQLSEKHLDKYIDEFEFRYNTREYTEIQRVDKMLTLCNRRLTYSQLIANEKDERTEPIKLPN